MPTRPLTNIVILTVHCKPFEAERAGKYSVRVDEGWRISVYDSIAGHYTVCHTLSLRSQACIRRKAAVFSNALTHFGSL